MSERDAPQATPRAGARSRKLTIAVIILAILPLLLPFPFYGLVLLWIGPLDAQAWSHCGFDCPAATDLERLGWLLILGPSLLVAVASILLGAIGRFRMRWRPSPPNYEGLFAVSMVCGAAWILLLGGVYWFIITILIYL